MTSFTSIYRNHNPEAINTHHVAHCFDYLRQTIMCYADVFPEGEMPDVGPGYGGERTCRDFDRIWQWSTDVQEPIFHDSLYVDNADIT